jgi:stage IV sporulation protein A
MQSSTVYKDLAARCHNIINLGIYCSEEHLKAAGDIISALSGGDFADSILGNFQNRVQSEYAQVDIDGTTAKVAYVVNVADVADGDINWANFYVYIGDAAEGEQFAKRCSSLNTPCVIAKDDMNTEDILRSFIVALAPRYINIDIPDWVQVMPKTSSVIVDLLNRLSVAAEGVTNVEDLTFMEGMFSGSSYWREQVDISCDMAQGAINVQAHIKDGVLYDMLSELSGCSITDEGQLLSYITSVANDNKNYLKFKDAISAAAVNGYGITVPQEEDMQLNKPIVVRKGGNVGVKLSATAPSYHIIRVDVCGEANPIMGSADRTEELVKNIMQGFESNPQDMWQSDLFGKSLRSMVNEGLAVRVESIPEDTRGKLRKTITRITNESKGGVVCILL